MSDTKQLQIHFYISVVGAPASGEFMRDLERVQVESSLHMPDVATLVLHDPGLRWIDDDRLAPGKPLVVSARAERDEHPLFDGEIVELEPSFEPGTQRLIVRAFDRLHRLGRGRQVRSFQNMTDGDLIKKIAQEVGLQAQVGPTSEVHAYLLQANETNLAFLQRRAAALGYLLYVEGETLFCKQPEFKRTPIALAWGKTMYEFHPRLTTLGQVNGVTARGWDPAQRREIIGRSKAGKGAPQVGQRQSGGAVAQLAFQLDAQYLIADRPIRSQPLADQLAQAVADRTDGRFIEAEIVCAGNPELVAGVPIQLAAVGDRFSGAYFVTAALHRHDISQGYITQLNVSGLYPSTLLSLLAPEPETLPTGGLVIGIVTDNQDPDGQGRVKVKYPWLSGDHASSWARIVVVGGGSVRGLEFLPEVNDEVLVGFEQGDIDYPYVLGGLWNGRDAPPRPNQEVVQGGQVRQRIIRSRSGHEIVFEDSDSGGSIVIRDSAGNTITLDAQQRAIAIESTANLSIKAGASMTLEAQGQMTLRGAIIELN